MWFRSDCGAYVAAGGVYPCEAGDGDKLDKMDRGDISISLLVNWQIIVIDSMDSLSFFFLVF